MLHDRMEVKADHAQLIDGLLRLLDRDVALGRLHRPPGLDDALGMPLPHSMNVFIGARRRRDRRLEVERHQHRLDSRIGEIPDHLFLLPGDPAAVPVLGERLDVGALAGDPLFGAGIAVQIDDSHAAFSRSSSAVTHSTSVFFETFPKADTGISGRTSSRSGSLNLAISLSMRKATSSLRARARPFFRITQAHIFSPISGSGIGMHAMFCTEGCERIRFSISSALIFSPPRLIRSFLRPSTT